MKTLMGLILLILFCQSGSLAQANDTIQVYHAVSKQRVLPVAIFQNDSPLFVEQIVVILNEKGMIETDYKVRNIGSKAIRGYRIARWYSDNTGYVGYGAMPNGGRLLKPKMSVETFSSKRILPAPVDEDKPGAMQKIMFVMIVDVEFDDGSKFDATSLFKTFEKHLELFESSY